MQTLIVYFSNYGNTQRIAEVICDEMQTLGEVRLLHIDDVVVSDLNHADVIIMGSPTHNMNLPAIMHPLFEMLPDGHLSGKAVAAFDTSYKVSGFLNRFTAGHRLASKLRRLGGHEVVPAESFLVTGRTGPLEEGEVMHARTWAHAIARNTQIAFAQTELEPVLA